MRSAGDVNVMRRDGYGRTRKYCRRLISEMSTWSED